jgi:hypothetical protein
VDSSEEVMCPKCGIDDVKPGETDCLICKKLTSTEALYLRKKVEERTRDIIRASQLLTALKVLRQI